MKKVLSFIGLILIFCNDIHAQRYDTLNNYGFSWGRGAFRTQFNLPFTDTTTPTSILNIPGAMVMKSSDSTIYVWLGNRWTSLGGVSSTSWEQTLQVEDTAITTPWIVQYDSSKQFGMHIIKHESNGPIRGGTLTATSGLRIISTASYTNGVTTNHELNGIGSFAGISATNTSDWTNTALVAGGRSIFSIFSGAQGNISWINGHHIRVTNGSALATVREGVGLSIDFVGNTGPTTYGVGIKANINAQASGVVNKTYFLADGESANFGVPGLWAHYVRQHRVNNTDTLRNYFGFGRSYYGDTLGNALLNVIGTARIDRGLFVGVDANDSGRAIQVDNQLLPMPGTVTVTSGSATVTGVGTFFLSSLKAGDVIQVSGGNLTILSIESNTSLTLTAAAGFNGADKTYSLISYRNILTLSGNGNIAGSGDWFTIGKFGAFSTYTSSNTAANATIRVLESNNTTSFTAASYTGFIYGGYIRQVIAAANTQNWTRSSVAGSHAGLVIDRITAAGSTGTVELGTGIYVSHTLNGLTHSNLRQAHFTDPGGTGAITRLIGIGIDDQTRGGTENVNLKMGSVGASLIGNYNIHYSGSYPNILGTGKTTVGSLNIGTVPEYADNAAAILGGLVNGDPYRTGDILKVVHP